jgi:hypothetical protein
VTVPTADAAALAIDTTMATAREAWAVVVAEAVVAGSSATAACASCRYSITAAGTEFLAANRDTADAMMARMNGGVDGAGPRGGRPPQVVRALENLKLAMRMRLSSREPMTDAQAHAFAAVLDSAAQQLERI